MNAIQFYHQIPLRTIVINDISIGLRQAGKGHDLVFIHGFPTHGYTWRKLIPTLSKYVRCHILDLPGLGDSTWTENTDFSSRAQAGYIIQLLQKIEIKQYSIVAHNSGATIARSIAITEPDKVRNLILFNTEIPYHRPPWIPLYQKIGGLPLVPFVIRLLFRKQWFINTSMGLKELYSDKSMLKDQTNIGPYLDGAIESHTKTIGVFKYLKGIDWNLVDDFKESHRLIKAKVLFLWGKDDQTFPIKVGRSMIPQFNNHPTFITINNASLLPHEEQPKIVLDEILKFLEK